MKMPTFPRAVDNPYHLPKLRDALREFMLDEHWIEAEAFRHIQNLLGPGATAEIVDGNMVLAGPNYLDPSQQMRVMEMADQAGRVTIGWYLTQLPKVQLIYVTDDLTDLVEQAAEAVPDDYVLHEENLPTPCGLAVFARPLWGIDAINDQSVRVDAFMWAPAMLPPKDKGWWYKDSESHSTPAISVAAFRLIEPEMVNDPQDHGARQWYSGRDPFGNRPFWMPLGRSDWVLGQQLDEPPHVDIDPESEAWGSMKEDRQLMASLWSILQQQRLTESRDVEVHTPRPKYQKAKAAPPERVQIVHLRKAQRTTRGEGVGHKISVRYVVRPFWRRQAYGPGWSKHRLILVDSHVRGPEGAPLSKGENVWKLEK